MRKIWKKIKMGTLWVSSPDEFFLNKISWWYGMVAWPISYCLVNQADLLLYRLPVNGYLTGIGISTRHFCCSVYSPLLVFSQTLVRSGFWFWLLKKLAVVAKIDFKSILDLLWGHLNPKSNWKKSNRSKASPSKHFKY